jgi:hypothetical protein
MIMCGRDLEYHKYLLKVILLTVYLLNYTKGSPNNSEIMKGL